MRLRNRLLLGIFLGVLALGAVSGVAATSGPVRERVEDALLWWADESTPAVFIASPAGPVSGTIRLAVSVRDRGPTALVGVTLDGRPLPPSDSITIDTKTLPDGPHRVVVTAEDRSRRRNQGVATAAFASDNTPPALTVRAVPETVAQGRTLFLEVATDGPPGLVSATVDGQPARLFPDAGRAWLVYGVGAQTPPGAITVTVSGADDVGNLTAARQVVTVTEYPFPVERIDAPEAIVAELTEEMVRGEGAAFEAITSGYRPEKLWQGPFLEPVEAPVSSEFGTRRQYNVSPPGPSHGGTDYAAFQGTPIASDAAGIVVLADRQRVRGDVVVVDHGLGVFSGYFHLSAIAVTPGQRVEKGDLIGRVGSTGLSTGPHLHWELRIRGVAVDPREWIQRTIPPPP